ncbi:MAG TPA: sigma-70 family RNA polymerase sigma factor [Burkholderiaceae bacterium]|nr:sigma-70 family RNA polymerase sigma factor [Burkholderiaceae bacterium]
MSATSESVLDLAEHRSAMLRFARRRVRDEALAEDTVQEALLAALTARDSFQGQSAVRTWLIGILNHKIQDAFRRETRYVKLDAHDDDAEPSGERLERAATASPTASEADDPVRAVARRRMHEALVREVEQLPESLKSVFLMQAIEGTPTADVCRRLNITEANVWVRLHRARKRLGERLLAHLEPA